MEYVEYTPLEVTVMSAKVLKEVNLFSKMDVYAVVSLADDPATKQKTPVDKDGGKNPKWDFPMKFSIDKTVVMQNQSSLVFQLKCQRSLCLFCHKLWEQSLGDDKEIGEVHVPVKELLDKLGDGISPQLVSYQVRNPSGKLKGTLNFSFKFGESVSDTSKVKGNSTSWLEPPRDAGMGISSVIRDSVRYKP